MEASVTQELGGGVELGAWLRGGQREGFQVSLNGIMVAIMVCLLPEAAREALFVMFWTNWNSSFLCQSPRLGGVERKKVLLS